MGFSRLGVLGLAVVVAATIPQLARADDRASLEMGRTAGRGLLILRDPRVCAIAVVRDRCKADVDALLGDRGDADFKDIPKIGPHPASGLRSFVTAGDRAGFDTALAYLNSKTSTAAMWTADPRDAALYDAGVEDVLLPAAQGAQVMEMLSRGPVIDLADHAASVPAGTFPIAMLATRPSARGASVPGAHELPNGAVKFAHDLVAAIDKATPPAPLATLNYTDGAAGDAALGVASATVAELIDSPMWELQADAQRFFDDYSHRLIAIAPASRAAIVEMRGTTRAGGELKHDAATRAYATTLGAILKNDQRHAGPVLAGLFAAQLVYNAAVLRATRSGGMYLRNLGDGDTLDSAVPGWSAARVAAKGVAADDWAAQYQLGVRLVELIRKANAS